MRGWGFCVAIAAGAMAVPLLAQNGKPSPAGPVDPTAATAADTVGLDFEQSRMTVPVSIGASGPYPFIIDTGSERTVVSNELAGTLKLAAGRRVRVVTMAGQSVLNTFLLPALQVSLVTPDTLEAPAVAARTLGAQGMLGIDALKGHSVSIDFDRNQMEVRPAKKRGMAMGPDDIVVRAKNVFGQLIVTDATYHRRRISVVIDTGSPITIGNLAFLKRVRTEKSLGEVSLLSVTGQWLKADYRVIDSLAIGGVEFQGVPIAFADALPFDRFGLNNVPALMLGMDTLKLFRRVQIDFANREIRLTLPKNAQLRSALQFGFDTGRSQ